MSAVIYTRQSLDKTGQAAGVGRQLDECRALAARKNIAIAEELSDNDTSATSGVRRPSFERLLSLVEAGVVSTVVVWHTDRLYRRSRDLERIIDAAEKGLQIVTVQAGDFDLNTPSGRLFARNLANVATFEGEHRTARQKASYRQSAEAGIWHFSHRPFGYRREGTAVVVVPEEASVVRDLMMRYYEQGESRHSLHRWLNGSGILTPRGNEWTIPTLRDLLTNSRYAGITSYNGVELGAPPQWEPIIAESDWRRWQTAAAKRKRKSTFTSAKHLLSGIARCGECGGVIYTKRRDDRLSYVCNAKLCVSRSAARVDDLVERVAIARLTQPDALDSLRPQAEPVEALNAERATYAARLEDLADLMADGTLDAHAVREAAKPLRAKLDALDARIEAVRGVEGLPLAELADDVPGRWSGLSLTQKRLIIRSLMQITIEKQVSRTFDPSSIRIEWRSPTGL
ncbi:recombinase family protein [Agromyces sp. NPDC058064]|uniref:recombinase family protein n=1 Tax=Agromyces sp. NPDC058064 TaxID=3346322 RepID=UPI0036DA47E5